MSSISMSTLGGIYPGRLGARRCTAGTTDVTAMVIPSFCGRLQLLGALGPSSPSDHRAVRLAFRI